jgi:hypothetical protein
MDCTVSPAVGLSVYLEHATLVGATTQLRQPEMHRQLVQQPVIRSFRGPTVWYDGSVSPTAKSNPAQVIVGNERPEDPLIAQVQKLSELGRGWDGEGAPAISKISADAAISFLRMVAPIAPLLEPTAHADGAVMLELDDTGVIRFNSDGTLSYAFEGQTPATVRFDGKTVPNLLKLAINI